MKENVPLQGPEKGKKKPTVEMFTLFQSFTVRISEQLIAKILICLPGLDNKRHQTLLS